MTFAESLKEMRTMRNLTQTELADIVGANISTYRHWEAGDNFPKQTEGNPLLMYRKLAMALNAKLRFDEQSNQIVLGITGYGLQELYCFNKGFAEGYLASMEEERDEDDQLALDDYIYDDGFKAGIEYALNKIVKHFKEVVSEDD